MGACAYSQPRMRVSESIKVKIEKAVLRVLDKELPTSTHIVPGATLRTRKPLGVHSKYW